ncbi:MAG: methyltransferase domain-containing protein [Patescibacteria group bacterium]|uniref:Methyltransferase domain-containing protein n=1 Tax=candidate division WWE3 bacterium TaxID=2053526 RepID=A0A955ECC4_UNCKA|nr:methyltransferase domain-containing protein [candidate division WWE3 bacterium]
MQNILKELRLPKTLYRTESKYNGVIEVVDIGSTRRLRVNGQTQSVNWDAPSAKSMYWGRAVEILKQYTPDMKSIVVLGLGGATTQHLLAKAFPGLFIVSVEIDKEMIEVSKQFFDAAKITNHHIYHADACGVVAHPEDYGLKHDSFDVIFVDIFVGGDYPELGKSGTFISGLKNVVKPHGYVLINRLYYEEFQEDVNHFVDALETTFSEVTPIVIAGRTNTDNMLILCKF